MHGVIVFTSDIIVVWATKVYLFREGFIYLCLGTCADGGEVYDFLPPTFRRVA